MVLVLLLQMQERLLGLLQDVFPPCEQLQAEIVPLALVHERLLVGRQIRLGFSSGQYPPHSLTSFVLGATICPPRGRLIYACQAPDNIRVKLTAWTDYCYSSVTYADGPAGRGNVEARGWPLLPVRPA